MEKRHVHYKPFLSDTGISYTEDNSSRSSCPKERLSQQGADGVETHAHGGKIVSEFECIKIPPWVRKVSPTHLDGSRHRGRTILINYDFLSCFWVRVCGFCLSRLQLCQNAFESYF